MRCISIHALREEGDRRWWRMYVGALTFLSTPSARRATTEVGVHALAKGISIHALREEGDALHSAHIHGVADFYPRPPRGGRPPGAYSPGRFTIFLSTPSARRATDFSVRDSTFIRFLSTPSARRATLPPVSFSYQQCYFYPRPPRGGRPPAPSTKTTSTRFLSTPSARRATSVSAHYAVAVSDFYPRPPRGGRLKGTARLRQCERFLSTPSARRATVTIVLLSTTAKISIHALREEGDEYVNTVRLRVYIFLSTPSARRATGGDVQRHRRSGYFYPRPPRGGRRMPLVPGRQPRGFLSTPSARRATRKKAFANDIEIISIHALREEGDDTFSIDQAAIIHFYPRPPRGGRQQAHQAEHKEQSISIHALREEGDPKRR